MNPTLKSIITLLLQFPLCYVAVNGLIALTGWSFWLCLLLSILITLSYEIGEMIGRGD